MTYRTGAGATGNGISVSYFQLARSGVSPSGLQLWAPPIVVRCPTTATGTSGVAQSTASLIPEGDAPVSSSAQPSFTTLHFIEVRIERIVTCVTSTLHRGADRAHLRYIHLHTLHAYAHVPFYLLPLLTCLTLLFRRCPLSQSSQEFSR